jgi:hypothetical protein
LAANAKPDLVPHALLLYNHEKEYVNNVAKPPQKQTSVSLPFLLSQAIKKGMMLVHIKS